MLLCCPVACTHNATGQRFYDVYAGDVNSIQVGDNTNIQDGATVHVARHNPQGHVSPTVIGSNVTIGAKADCMQLIMTQTAGRQAPIHRRSALAHALMRKGLFMLLQATAPQSMHAPWRTAAWWAWEPCCWTASRCLPHSLCPMPVPTHFCAGHRPQITLFLRRKKKMMSC